MKLEEPVVIVKNSRKPFKSGKYVETSGEIVTNPQTGRPAYLLEDGTNVEVIRCTVIRP
jgi:hypothetical protein